MAPEFRALLDVPPGTSPQWNYNIAGQPVTEVTRPVQWALNNIKGECSGWVMSMRPEWQALAGYEVLKDYRITIDYTRRKLLLEPNPAPSPAATLPQTTRAPLPQAHSSLRWVQRADGGWEEEPISK